MGATRGKAQQFAEGETAAEGPREVFGLQLLFMFSLPTGLFTWSELFLTAELCICNNVNPLKLAANHDGQNATIASDEVTL